MINSLSVASALSGAFAVFALSMSSPRVLAKPTPDQDALEKVGVAFASMVWLPRLDSACALYKKGLISEEQLPEAYKVLYEGLATDQKNPEGQRTFATLMKLLEAGPKAMAAYLEASESDLFEIGYFDGCPLPNKALGY